MLRRNFSGSTRDRMYLKARAGASCMEEIIWGHDLCAYRIPGNDRRLPPDAGRKEGSHLECRHPGPPFGVCTRNAPRFKAVARRERRSERVWQFDCKIDREVVTILPLLGEIDVGQFGSREKNRVLNYPGKLDAQSGGLGRRIWSQSHKLSRRRTHVIPEPSVTLVMTYLLTISKVLL